MKRITSRKASRRSSISKPSAPVGSLQYFTYDDVGASAEPQVGDFPKHGDTVALGDAEQEVEAARSRASRRISQTIEGREHEDIFANAPEEPLAPEEPRGSRRESRRGSKRSSRRVSRRSSMDGGLGPSTSRGSRAISPERDGMNGHASHSRRDSRNDRRLSRRASDIPHEPAEDPITAVSVTPPAPTPSTKLPVEPVQSYTKMPKPPVPLATAADTPPTAPASPPNAPDNALSQVPTAEDFLSRAQTVTSSGGPSRQSTRGGEFGKRTSIMTTGSTKSKTKSKRQSRRSSKPEPLKYFTYDDVTPAKPPIFGQIPNSEGEPEDGTSRIFKGKEREVHNDGIDNSRALEDAPQVPELPQKLAHMDLSGTGLTRSSTRDTAAARVARREAQRTSVPVNASVNSPESVESQGRVSAGTTQVSSRGPTLAATHGLDFSDIPGMTTGRRAPAPPPPVNMSTKPPSKRPSRDMRSDTTTEATAAGATSSHRSGAPKPGRTSSFQEQLPEALRHGGVQETNVKELNSTDVPAQTEADKLPAPQSVLEKTKQILGLGHTTLPASESATSAVAIPVGNGNPDTGFVSAPSSPVVEKGPFVPPSTGMPDKTSQNTNASAAVPPAASHRLREERLTREIRTYNASDPGNPIVDIEVLSTRYFMQLEDGRFVEVVEKDIPSSTIASARANSTVTTAVSRSHEHLSSQNI